jgi:iron complex outermembrane receptor protein
MTVGLRRVLVLGVAVLGAWPAARAADVSITGRVVDEQGTPLPGVALVARGADARRGGFTDQNGEYRVKTLPPGRYRVTATLAGYVTLEEEVDVTGDGPVALDFQLRPAFEETVVVSSARRDVALEDSPTTISVIDRDVIETSPGRQVGDLLRTVPGMNVVQSSARDVNVASRQASPFLTGSQLALVDGRPLYFDFFNVVFWDLMSVGAPDAAQIEVVRGPASAMWGANAVTGVVNVVTRAPRDSLGLEVSLMGGALARSSEFGGTGGLGSANVRWADAIDDRLAYRISAGYFSSDPFERPTGTLPVIETPIEPSVTVGGGSFDDVQYDNQGTAQPRLDLRLDQELGDDGRLIYGAGYSGTQGIIHTTIGPFDLQDDTSLAYGQVRYERGNLHAAVFANLVGGDAPSLISLGADGEPLEIDFSNGVYDLDVGWRDLFFTRHLMSFGGNVRLNTFDISIAPDADTRTQAGVYVQDEIDLGRVRLALALRADYFDNLDDLSWSPRVALIWTPITGHSFKASYSRGFRAPSAIENHLDISVIGGYFPVSEFDPRLEEDFPLVVHTIGNEDLEAEVIDAVEIGYSAVLGGGRTRVDLNVYRNETDNLISNNPPVEALLEAGIDPYYTSDNPPPGWPLPPFALDFLAQLGVFLPSTVQILNIGAVRNEGIELSASHRFEDGWTVYGNYSYQALPELLDPVGDPDRPQSQTVSTPPEHRANLGVSYTGPTYLGSVTVNHTDEAFFAQGLNPSYLGYSDAYTIVGATFGRRWMDGRLTTTVRAVNLFDEAAQQHVFGDVLRRTVMLELGYTF